jgi:phospholipid/cholesterol/gamma-HCH transport system permease protein
MVELLLLPIRQLGALFLINIRALGKAGIFIVKAIALIFLPPYKPYRIIKQIRFTGVNSTFIVLLTGIFTGMVLGIQGFYSLNKFGAESLLGPIVALSLIRELGPVLSALMVTARAGSALAAEIGIMRITEQIDALEMMALNPIRYLVVPNIVAGILAFPILTSFFDLIGIFGGYLVGVKMLGLSEGGYFGEIRNMVTMKDLAIGFYKSISFGIIVNWVCCYKGYYTGYGAEGVSKATTEAVVISSVLILVWDYFMASFFF